MGELWARGAQVIKGYLNRADATAESITDGWLHTGDIARVDEDGTIFIVDRKKDMVLRGGANVYCAEVEASLYRHPAIAECSVFGVPDERLGEEVAAAVFLRPGHQTDAAALREPLHDDHGEAQDPPLSVDRERAPPPPQRQRQVSCVLQLRETLFPAGGGGGRKNPGQDGGGARGAPEAEAVQARFERMEADGCPRGPSAGRGRRPRRPAGRFAVTGHFRRSRRGHASELEPRAFLGHLADAARGRFSLGARPVGGCWDRTGALVHDPWARWPLRARIEGGRRPVRRCSTVPRTVAIAGFLPRPRPGDWLNGRGRRAGQAGPGLQSGRLAGR